MTSYAQRGYSFEWNIFRCELHLTELNMLTSSDNSAHLSTVRIDNELYFQLSDVNKMPPFFMSIVSDSNHWMFISSNGGLSAGRKNAELALFPYYTDDKITESVENTGSKSIFLVQKGSKKYAWEPFSIRNSGQFKFSRNLYKNRYGNKILFEEINHDLKLSFRYQWNSSNSYGFVRKCSLENLSNDKQSIIILDGLQNIMPSGVGSALQNQSSNLVDAYKRSELLKESGIGVFGLSAIIVDKAEPSEALKTNVVWSLGLDNPIHLLSSSQVDQFRIGLPIKQEEDIKGQRGAFLVSEKIDLSGNSSKKWLVIADVNKTVSSVIALSESIKNDKDLESQIEKDIELGTRKLVELNASSDAIQLSSDQLRDTRHFSNTLFNIMRGGIFDNNYQIEKNDLKEFLYHANRDVYRINEHILNDLLAEFSLTKLKKVTSNVDNMTFRRLCMEYLPLKFSRRHGDPSRPWNKFSINTHNEHDGSKILDYEGNWRDIFQNWEALVHSFPEFIDGMISRFLNASTFDGYNPYRITKNGIDWERIEPDDPWSYIGYWGDHQIIYLLKFLEFSESRYPGKLQKYFKEDLFVYANVPYRIKSYRELLQNPKDTIVFDQDSDNIITEKWSRLGADGALLCNQKGDIAQVNFVEKILATVLAKMSNFIPEGGIWMNTQRPEWNDANNALVGNGVSMVTLYYLYRFLNFMNKLLKDTGIKNVSISEELKVFLDDVTDVLEDNKDILTHSISNKARKQIMDGLGEAASKYRLKIYSDSFDGEKQDVEISEILRFVDLSLKYTEQTIKANKREDNLYHAYNIMSVLNKDEVSISYLSEMLEGQVAVLSSGFLSSKETLEVLDALKRSELYREDQSSYILYPNKELPGFMDKNNIPDHLVNESELLKALLNDGNTSIIEQDIRGNYHFNGNFRNVNDLKSALDHLSETPYTDLLESGSGQVIQIFEKVFNHKAFTGRSGTFFGYEGLGSIYWHMVSKLALSVQECCLKAIHNQEEKDLTNKLIAHYYEINEGLGIHKSPAHYGAFPTDPYSHTPFGKGAQQPGMTGQVKEDILCRFGELGITVSEGKLGFDPCMLRKKEFVTSSEVFHYIDVNSEWKEIEIKPESLCFTYCQVPVIYQLDSQIHLQAVLKDGTKTTIESLELDHELSSEVFQRSSRIEMIIVNIDRNVLQ
jgi:hypothetical protein